jgi:hypothetical protein
LVSRDEEDGVEQRSEHFRHLRWSLHALAMAGSEQQMLFPLHIVKAEELASDYDHWSAVVRSHYESELPESQLASLDAIDKKLAIISRDGAEFDLELWTDAALRGSEHWAEVRALAASALEAFGWPIETPSRSSNDQGTLSAQ